MEDLTIGQRIAAKRKELGLSQIALGQEMNVSRQSISKWEADAAIPEIDKLIALSKLFGVSVGWLLGVEEGPDPTEEAGSCFTDREWEIIDQLTQSQPRLPNWLVPLTAAATAIALIAVILAGAAFSNARSSREALTAMSQSIAMMTAGGSGLEDPSVLKTYQFVLNPSSDLERCTLEFIGTPPAHTPGTTAELLIFADGEKVNGTACEWDGYAYTGFVSLDVRDGYTAVFTVTSEGGLVRSTVLYDDAVNWMSSAAAFDTVSVGYAEYTYRDGVLTLDGLYFLIDLPDLLRDTEDLWERCDLVVMANGQELGRLDMLNRSKHSKQINFSGDHVDFLTQTQSIEIGDIDRYSHIELLLDCSFTTRLTMQKSIKIWTVNDGKI